MGPTLPNNELIWTPIQMKAGNVVTNHQFSPGLIGEVRSISLRMGRIPKKQISPNAIVAMVRLRPVFSSRSMMPPAAMNRPMKMTSRAKPSLGSVTQLSNAPIWAPYAIQQSRRKPKMLKLMTRSKIFMGALIALLALAGQVLANATLLPNGQQCFQATAPTSGGLYGPITSLGTIAGGSGYAAGTYTNVPLTGGSGFGALATVTVSGGSVVNLSLTNPGSHYTGADTLSATAASIGGSGTGFSVPVVTVSTTGTGMLGLLGPITGGSGGVAGTYAGVSLTGGSGSGATANITVSGGAVTAIAILNPGNGYQVADTLSAISGTIGGTTGFSVQVSSVSINQSLAGGSVFMYVPATNTFKQTWQNAQQTVLNQNPVTLDQNGCATMYGTGSYRQVLQDAMGNVVWDKITTDTSAQQNVFWAGIATGTQNALVITDPGFNGSDGSIINFLPLVTNSGAATITIPGTGFNNIPIVKDTTGGAVTLTGGELNAGPLQNVVSVVYSALESNFHLLNTVIASASGATSPLCGAVGLKITNGGSPNAVISLTANQIVMQTAAGLTINRSNVSLTNINITTGNSVSTANGMDGEAPGNSNWLYVWAIDNGAAPAGLVSLAGGNGLAPILPSGYTYKCRLGAVRVDGGGALFRTLQFGPETQYVVTPATNTAALPVITSSFGSYWTANTVSNAVPPSAIKAMAQFSSQFTNATSTASTVHAAVAPNNNYATTPTSSAFPPCAAYYADAGGITAGYSLAQNQVCVFALESANVYTGILSTANITAVATLSALGWRDNVNAN
jgi:hypothetical protein